MEIMLIIIGIAVGIIIGYLLGKSGSAGLKAELSVSKENYDKNIMRLEKSYSVNIDDKDKQIQQLNQKNEKLNSDLITISAEKAHLESEKAAIDKKLDEQADNLHQQFEQMKEQFRNIATAVIKDNSTDINKINTESLRNIINPFKDKIEEFKNKVDKCYVDEVKERFSLQEEIKRLVEANQKIGEDANNLATALKGNSKVQGDWGEMILDDILAKSGLKDGIHYHKQEYTRDDSGNIIVNDEGGKMRTDVIVDFPGGRKMIIDSKVSLTAYVNYMNATDKESANKAIKEHLKSVTTHIDELSRVDYSKYIDSAPDFVMMFIPNEPAYYLALQADTNLWNYAYNHKVVIMSPTNLITALRLSLDLWRRDDQIKNLDKIVQTASSLYDKIVLFKESMDKIGANIEGLHSAYNDAMIRLASGKGNMLTLTQKLMKYGVTPKKRLSIPDNDDDEAKSDVDQLPS
jgi:DNA recombination protein RmuC